MNLLFCSHLKFYCPPSTFSHTLNYITNNILKNKKEKVKKEKFTPPTLEEVQKYANSRNRADLATRFFDYFEAGAWKDSLGKPVKNWKQKFITWENHNAKMERRVDTSCQYSEEDLARYRRED